MTKTCPCGQRHDRNDWERLRLVGTMDDGDGGTLELRNCQCGSTISVLLDPPPQSVYQEGTRA